MTSERINYETASKIANILSSQKFSSDIMAKRLQVYKFLERYLLLNLPDIVRAAYAECPDYFKYNNVTRMVVNYMKITTVGQIFRLKVTASNYPTLNPMYSIVLWMICGF